MQSNSIKGLDENETFDFVSYLTAEDAGTYAWQERGRKLAKQWDIELEILDSYIYESFNTRIALIANEADSFFEKMEEFSGK
jgi:hypothetical protein